MSRFYKISMSDLNGTVSFGGGGGGGGGSNRKCRRDAKNKELRERRKEINEGKRKGVSDIERNQCLVIGTGAGLTAAAATPFTGGAAAPAGAIIGAGSFITCIVHESRD